MSGLPSHVYAVILAGGSGTRFWPKSRHLKPKQLCTIGTNELTLLEQTLIRLDLLIPPERRLIVTHKEQMEKTKLIAKGRCANFLAEPSAKNTANALALAALEIGRNAPAHEQKPIMISVHADALVDDTIAFQKAVEQMVEIAEAGRMTLLGITPEYPEIAYGYIEKAGALVPNKAIFTVSSFREKPDLKTALEYLKTGHFLWNSGIFAWRIDVLLEELKTFLPDSFRILSELLDSHRVKSFNQLSDTALAHAYSLLANVAIDNAVLEKSHKVAVVEADIGWKDLGSWNALHQCFPTDKKGNLLRGKVIAIDSEGITVDSDIGVVACIGLRDLVVVVSEGAVLVCPKERAQDVKKVVEELKNQGRLDLI